MPFTIACPNCSMTLAVSEAHVGQQGKCSRCGTVFTIEYPRVAQPIPLPVTGPNPVQEVQATGSIRVAEGISHGFTILHSNLGNFILIGLCMVAMGLLIGVFAPIPCIGPIIVLGAALVGAPALNAGFYRACLKQADGGHGEVGDLFAEFEQWLEYVLLFLIKLAIGLLLWIPGAVLIGLSLIPLGRGNHQPNVALLVLGILVLLFSFVTWGLSLLFVLPALVDRRRGIGDALATSWRLMMSNPLGAFGAVLMAALLSMLGTLACCVGWVYTLPATFCMFASIYRTAVPRSIPVEAPGPAAAPPFQPPPPPGPPGLA